MDATRQSGLGVLSREKKEVNDHAFASSVGFSSGSRRTALGGEPHTHARNDQVHFECSGGDCGCSVAFEYFWISAFHIRAARRQVSLLQSTQGTAAVRGCGMKSNEAPDLRTSIALDVCEGGNT